MPLDGKILWPNHPNLEQADLPPVIVFNPKLICCDTEPRREFASGFDSSMGVSSFLDFLPQDGRASGENVWWRKKELRT